MPRLYGTVARRSHPSEIRRFEMLLIAFVAFFVLVLAWLIAPNGEPAAQPAPAPVPSLKVGEASA